MALISLIDWAREHDMDRSNAAHMAAAGRFSTAVKVGRDWLIDSDESTPSGYHPRPAGRVPKARKAEA